MLEAAARRQAREEQLVAILGCWIMAPWSRRRLTPEKLIKPPPIRRALEPSWWPYRASDAAPSGGSRRR
jgi:hypothetical protein